MKPHDECQDNLSCATGTPTEDGPKRGTHAKKPDVAAAVPPEVPPDRPVDAASNGNPSPPSDQQERGKPGKKDDSRPAQTAADATPHLIATLDERLLIREGRYRVRLAKVADPVYGPNGIM